MSKIKLIVGLGNPGEEYAHTRHNIGFMAVEKAGGGSPGWKMWHGAAQVREAESLGGITLFKPLAYMNNSGIPVKKFMDFYRIVPEELLVVLDDFSLLLGTVRLRLSGSSGGHNGLSSIEDVLGTQGFARLRLGIGPVPEKIPSADFVLSRFKKSETEEVNKMLERAEEALRNAALFGLEKAASKLSHRTAK